MNINRDLSAEARSAKVDRLDESIDRVAARMTRVEENHALASQIINALPERSIWSGWLFHSWAPRLAMVAILVTAGIVWNTRRSEPITPSPLLIASAPAISTPTTFMAAVPELEPNRTKPMEPLELLEPVEPARPDFDRSLPSIAAVASLELDSLAPVSLPEDAPLTLKPLEIADLPLTADSISPR